MDQFEETNQREGGVMNATPRTAGRYWRLAWSNCWAERNPWSLSGRLAPYVGVLRNNTGTVVLRTLGPIALISVEILSIPPKGKHTKTRADGEGE